MITRRRKRLTKSLLIARYRLFGWLGAPVRVTLAAVGAIIAAAAVVLAALDETPSAALGITAVVAAAAAAGVVPRWDRRHRPVNELRSSNRSVARVLREHPYIMRQHRKSAVLWTLNRTRSVPGREFLAFLASGGALSLERILAALGDYRDPQLRRKAHRVLRPLDAVWTPELAKILFTHGASANEALSSATLYEYLATRFGMHRLSRGHLHNWTEALLAAGLADQAAELLRSWDEHGDIESRLLADTVNPFSYDERSSERSGDVEAWLRYVNAPLIGAGLEPVSVGEGSVEPLDRIVCEPTELIDGAESVTVVITAFCPDEKLLSATRSALRSSWRNLRVLIVDDASGPEYDDIYRQMLELDPRVDVERLTENGGTYAARNFALANVTSDLVTFQDSDDWMHPRRIQRQVEHLREHPELLANLSSSVRVTDQLEFSNHRPIAAKLCEPSILLRRERVVATVGYFDRVRKNADAEYRRRIGAFSGEDVPIVEPIALTWQRSTLGSLSFAEIGRDWVSQPRRVHTDAASMWHERIAEGSASALLPDGPRRDAVFYAPPEVRGTQPDSHFDVVFLSDWLVRGRHGTASHANEDELVALLAAGYRVAIAHVEAFWSMNDAFSRFSTGVLDLLASGRIELVQLNAHIETDLLVIRFPPLLEFLNPSRSGIRAGRVVVVATQAPQDSDGSVHRYDVALCSQRVTEAFGLAPSWIPQGPTVRAAIADLVAPRSLSELDLGSVIDRGRWATAERPRDRDQPVVGRYSRDHISTWPATRRAARQAYSSARFDTVIMGASRSLTQLFGDRAWPRRWIVYDDGARATAHFLSRLDFFVYFCAETQPAVEERFLLEALASGVVVILPRRFEPVFGDAALYREPREVEQTVLELFADPDTYRAQVERGWRHLEQNCDAASYVSRIRLLLPEQSRPTVSAIGTADVRPLGTHAD